MSRIAAVLFTLVLAVPLVAFARDAGAGGAPPPAAMMATPTGGGVVCESNDNRFQRCRVPSNWGAAQLAQQLSQTACTRGRTWGFDPGSVWVDKGCRGRFAQAFAGGTHPTATVQCESIDNSRTRCRAPANWRDARLVQQLSQTTCVRGQNWGFDRGDVWVAGGCRGRFTGLVQGTYPPNPGNLLQCESFGDARTRCRAPSNWRDARVAQQLSQTACVKGRNWGFERGSIWVDGGCRARFAQAGYNGNHPPGAGRIIDCGSSDNRPRSCAVPHDWRGVRLVQQLSKSACVEGGTWGFNRGAIWVVRGCRARFAQANGGGWQPGLDWNQDFPISCGSPQYQYYFCKVDVGARGRVVLQRQTSGTRCVEGSNWGWNRAGIWVDKGCSAQFLVVRRW